MSMIWTFDGTEIYHNLFRDRMKKFYEEWRINSEKKKTIPWQKEQQESYEKEKTATFAKKV